MNETITDSPQTLRDQMVDRITTAGWAHTSRVAEAMRAVPRHLFVPDATLAEAYDDRAVIIKRGPDGKALSCASEQVHVATRDGALGDPDHAPYDRIILTVGAWDIPTAWWDQLAPGGRLVVPLRWRGLTRSIAFDYTDGIMRSDSVHLCGFVPMLGQEGEQIGRA